MIKLGQMETTVYHGIWSFGVFNSLYRLHIAGNVFNSVENTNYLYGDFSPGLFQRLQDVSDFEWNCWTMLFMQLIPGLMINCLGSVILGCLRRQELLPWWYSIVGLVAAAATVGRPAAGLFLFIVICFYLTLFLKRPWTFWLLGFLLRRYVSAKSVCTTPEDEYIVEVACSWIILRCLTYCCEASKPTPNRILILTAYSLYLPTLFCGPLLPFPHFLRCTLHTRRFFLHKSISPLLRCVFWYFFTTIALHFVYVNAILLRPYMVENLSTWELAGLGIATGHFFHLKYTVFYGFPSVWATTEGFVVPKSPCCVSRVYLYSTMWRCFDPGLYNFLVRYIYVPVRHKFSDSRLISRTLGSVSCFYFVYVWHGEERYVLYWVLLNFTAVTIESLGYDVYNIPRVKRVLCRCFDPANRRRLHCLLAAPLLYFSMVSNFFFIANHAVGEIFVQRAMSESLINTIYIVFILYGAAQSSLTFELEQKTTTNSRRATSC